MVAREAHNLEVAGSIPAPPSSRWWPTPRMCRRLVRIEASSGASAFKTIADKGPNTMSTDTSTRQEHLDWCKQRALEYVDAGNYPEAVASMMSDLKKHPETQGHVGIELGMLQLMSDLMSTEPPVRRWIEGFR